MKNYPIIKSNEAVTVLFTAPRSGYVLEYFDDHYKDILYKSDWSEGAFSNVGKSWFKGKCINSNNINQNRFICDLIFNHNAIVFPDADKARVFFLNKDGRWDYRTTYCIERLKGLKQLRIPFNEIFNDTTVTTELKGAPPAPSASPSVEERYRACVKLINDLLAENERNNGDYILNEKQVWLINELINTGQFLIDSKSWLKTKLANHFNRPISDNDVEKCIDELIAGYNAAAETVVAKPASKTPLIEWKETHEVKIGYTWFQVEPVFVSEVEMFFYDPRPTQAVPPSNGVRQSNLSVINLNSPDYRNNEIGYLCIDDDGVLHPYDPESGVPVVKLCKNIL